MPRLLQALAIVLCLLALSPFLPAAAVAQPFPAALDRLRLETVTDDLPGSPVAITHAGDERLFVTLKEGLIVIWDGERVLPEPFLDLRGQVGLQFEQGLLSVAFHPDYTDNGFFFVDFTNNASDTVIARFRVSEDPDRADPDSRVNLLVIEQPGVIHNGGQLQFGPDGYLYIGMGDGGGRFDPLCSAQRTDTLLGKMLRIDVDASPNQPPFHGIPAGNPFVGAGDPPDEVWAMGFRNPWRFSFDRATGDLYIADVGQGLREEVSFQPADSTGGENYGWKVMEGTFCQSDEGCPPGVPPCNDPAYTPPILEVEQGVSDDCAVIGGYVYRGSEIPEIDGVYLYGDFCSGIVRAGVRNGSAWESHDLDLRAPTLTTFGEDVEGELYLATLGRTLFRLRSAEPLPQVFTESLRLETLATDLPGSPVAVTSAGDDRLFLTTREGRILIWDGQQILPDPFLDLRGQVSLQGEQGLFSTAFHPQFADNGVFYVNFTDPAGDTVIARFEVSADPDRADPESRVEVLEIPQPRPAHNGGQLQFGPDGFLYIGMGDGGTAFDEFCTAQRLDTLLGKMLRIDVDPDATSPPFYTVPDDNPFVGPDDPPDEVWALGFRNPWRFSFDRVTGDLFIADVGQAQREEISFQPAGSSGGENYGWKVMEGTLCQSDENCPLPVPPCNDPAYTNPILEYPHTGGDCAVIGGHVYRGSRLPGLQGRYLYGDFCSGLVRVARRSGGFWSSEDSPIRLPLLTGFGEDSQGEIYLVTFDGGFYRLASTVAGGPCVPGPNTLCLNEGRFRVDATWRDFGGGSGLGTMRPLTDDTGTFWFFDPANLELVVKVIDACGPPFNRYWVFAGGLTNVEVDLTVVDTEALDEGAGGSAAVQRYVNLLGVPFAPVQDTDAFATCP